MHFGQHGSADPTFIIQASRPAKPAEYEELKEELEKIGYCLRVVKRHTGFMLDKRKQELKKFAEA
jgi:hypothetical protein